MCYSNTFIWLCWFLDIISGGNVNQEVGTEGLGVTSIAGIALGSAVVVVAILGIVIVWATKRCANKRERMSASDDDMYVQLSCFVDIYNLFNRPSQECGKPSLMYFCFRKLDLEKKY